MMKVTFLFIYFLLICLDYLMEQELVVMNGRPAEQSHPGELGLHELFHFVLEKKKTSRHVFLIYIHWLKAGSKTSTICSLKLTSCQTKSYILYKLILYKL